MRRTYGPSAADIEDAPALQGDAVADELQASFLARAPDEAGHAEVDVRAVRMGEGLGVVVRGVGIGAVTRGRPYDSGGADPRSTFGVAHRGVTLAATVSYVWRLGLGDRASGARSGGRLEGCGAHPYTSAITMSSPDTEQPADLTLDEVRHLATLSRLGMTDAELEKFRRRAGRDPLATATCCGAWIRRAWSRRTTGPTWSTCWGGTRRGPRGPVEKVLANVPNRDDDLIRVRAVLE